MKDQIDNYELRETRIASMEADLARLKGERKADMPPGWVYQDGSKGWALKTDQFAMEIGQFSNCTLRLIAPDLSGQVPHCGNAFHQALAMELELSHYVNAIRETLGRNV